MQCYLRFQAFTAAKRRKIGAAVFVVWLLLLMAFIPACNIGTIMACKEPSKLVIRIDDVQDFAFREAQLFLLNESMLNEVPLSLAVIAGMFGRDSENVQTVKLAISLGSDIAVHGWKHEDFSRLSAAEQSTLLHKSKKEIKAVLDYNVRTFIPPMFSFNDDTITAMLLEGYDIISTSADLERRGLVTRVATLPATIELSDFKRGVWTMKSLEAVKAEIIGSVEEYGFAIIVTHPQEFMIDGIMNQDNVEYYRTLLRSLKKDCVFMTLESLAEHLNSGLNGKERHISIRELSLSIAD